MINIDQKMTFYKLAETLAGLGHWSINLEANTLFWSDEVYRIHGLDKDAYTPDVATAIDFYHPGDRGRVTKYVQHAIEKQISFEFSLRLVRPDGEIRYVNVKGQPQLNSENKVSHIFGIFLDVTQEMNTKEYFKRIESLHQSYIESSNDGYWDWYIKEDYEYMSSRFWEMFGYQAEEQPRKPSAWQALIFEEDLAVALDNFERHIASFGDHPFEQEARYRHKDGSTVTVLCRGKVIEWDDEDKSPIRMVGTHTDITDLKAAQTLLIKNLAFQRLLMNTNTDLVFVKDAQFRIVEANTAFLSLYPEGERDRVIGSTTLESYSPEDVDAFLVEDKRAFTSGHSEIVEIITFPDGEERALLTKKTRFEDANQNAFILGVARNITEIKQAEKKLARLNEELEEFAYRTSHDLRSPLISTERLLDITVEEISRGDSSNTIDYIYLARESLKKLNLLVLDILRLAQISHEELPPVKVDLQAIIDECVQKLSHMEGFERICFRYDYQWIQPIMVEQSLVVLVVENLISNAIKYQDMNKDPSTISIHTREDKGQLLLAISDNGLGIPQKNRDSLFKMFKRFHPKTSFGSGLGLYMMKKSVERMNGSIAYQALTNGTKFIVHLPTGIGHKKGEDCEENTNRNGC